ncbi:testis development-related protein isoform X2 [Girardinichthys multiradiatus]|uniref:testis development-related protein isoform X2 n=1 Tax=Girardinichthys multiradiatus TaxID=208333 RepID=UPI001FACE887|nr:testis development-related protein isoform X2 [Girardinichthys multiradiatus]
MGRKQEEANKCFKLCQDKDMAEEEEEEAVTAIAKEAKVKKMMSKKERKEKKMLSFKDDEHLLLSGVKVAERKVSNKKVKESEKEKEKKDKPEKGHCFWDSVTMTMRQISPAKKLEKMEGWEPPQLGIVTETDETLVENGQNGESELSVPPDSISIPLEIPSWGGQGFEEDSSHYANLTDSNDPAAAVRWTARAKVKLAGISRMSRGIVSESPWAGFKQ